MLANKNILLIITGGIAAYKALELIRLLRKDGASVRCILTQGGAQFITPLSVATLSENPVYGDLWSLKDETEMGHIRLSRESDLIVIAPASADFMAKMACGLAGDLASATVLAADKPMLLAPAMNPQMWHNLATAQNKLTLEKRGVTFIGPAIGDTACGEAGTGRMSEPEDILAAIRAFFFEKKLSGLKAIVTAGPTYEPIDPVRFIGNHSSGKQGYALARALHQAGAAVSLITGPSDLQPPQGVLVHTVQTAQEMHDAVFKVLPADIAICAAAVSDWRAQAIHRNKIKKTQDEKELALTLEKTPDILRDISALPVKTRPKLVVGFAAETENLLENAQQKLQTKHCDWIVANAVGVGKTFNQDNSHVTLITAQGTLPFPHQSKAQTAQMLVHKIMEHFMAHAH